MYGYSKTCLRCVIRLSLFRVESYTETKSRNRYVLKTKVSNIDGKISNLTSKIFTLSSRNSVQWFTCLPSGTILIVRQLDQNRCDAEMVNSCWNSGKMSIHLPSWCINYGERLRFWAAWIVLLKRSSGSTWSATQRLKNDVPIISPKLPNRVVISLSMIINYFLQTNYQAIMLQ